MKTRAEIHKKIEHIKNLDEENDYMYTLSGNEHFSPSLLAALEWVLDEEDF